MTAAAQFWADRGIFAAQTAGKYRQWAADKKSSYESRLTYDKWAADYEGRVIRCADMVIKLLDSGASAGGSQGP